MIGAAYAHSLPDDWRRVLDVVAGKIGGPTSRDTERLAGCVEALSRAYNDSNVAKATAKDRDIASARLLFSFPRDVPKSAAAVRELVADGAVVLEPERPLRVLDLGAGLGASTFGLVMALEAAGQVGTVDVVMVDPDEAALGLASSIVAARPKGAGVELKASFFRHRLTGLPAVLGRFDVVLLGQVLSELDVAAPPLERVALHAKQVSILLEHLLTPHGSIVIIEPALRARARHLQALRDALLAAPAPPSVFAPCLHSYSCPALLREGDWCHEDMDIDLPAWLVPVAKGAGLRYEGLTFSYLVLRKDGRELRRRMPAGGQKLRVISSPMVTKGKLEAFVCAGGRDGQSAGEQLRVCRLNRDESPSNVAWSGVRRGDCLVVTPPVDSARARLTAETEILNWVPPALAAIDGVTPHR